MEVCRACLTIEDEMIPLNEALVAGYNLLTNLNAALLDAMPQYMCQGCSQSVRFFMDFREKCITTETSLQEVIFKKIKSEDEKPLSELKNENVEDEKPLSELKNESIEIKQEILEEENDNFEFDGDYFSEELLMQVKSETSKDIIKPKKQKRKKNKITAKKCQQELNIDDKFSCGICKKTSSEYTELSTHIESHKGSRSCELCFAIFKTWPTLLGHRITHIPKKEYRCHICKKRMWGDEARVTVRMEYHYMNKHYDGEKALLSCKWCFRSYETPRQLSKHIAHAHSKNCFTCDYCNNTYNNKQRLISHIRCHSEDRTFVCELCGFASKHSGGLKDHKIRKHAPDKVKCIECERWFATPADREKHVCNISVKICPICGKQLAATKSFNRHMYQHSSVKRYKCARCPAAYKTKGALVAHNNRHDGVRPVQCPLCPLKFFTHSVLTKHKRTHTGEKPYVCKVCNKGFTGNHNLKVHMKVHGEYLVVKRTKTGDDPPYPFPAYAPPTTHPNTTVVYN